MLVNSDREE